MTGLVSAPEAKVSVIVIEDGKIAALGDEDALAGLALGGTLDVQGMTVAPGFIDSHVHPVLGDFTPRQKMLDFIESSLHGGVTSMISAGEAHTPGRPKDPAGVKALAVLAHKSSVNARPGQVKLHGGALILEKGLKESDFVELAEQGVWLVGEIGLGSVREPEEAAEMVAWAHEYGFKVAMHTGGTSIPGSSVVGADAVIAVRPDVVSHLNGGPTAAPPAEVKRIIEDSDLPVEIVQCGNVRVALDIARKLGERSEFERLVLGTDTPSGTGVIPLGILRNLAFLASVGDVDPGVAIACATGNTARVFGLSAGVIAPGKEADFVVMDAPIGSAGRDAAGALVAGDLPGIAAVIVDGKLVAQKSRNTAPPNRSVKVAGEV